MSVEMDATRDLLVVGAGPVGLITALLGARAGLDVEIIDQEWRIATRSYACALHPHTLALLDDLGLLERALEMGVRVETLGFYEGADRKAEVNLGALPGKHPFALVLYQDDLEGLVEDALRERHGRRVGWGRRLDGLIWHDQSMTGILEVLQHRSTGESERRWTEVVERRQMIQARYLVGADGPHSRLLHLLGTGSDVAGEPTTYGVYEFEPRSEVKPQRELRVAIEGASTHVLWPLPGGTCRWTLQTSAATAEGDDAMAGSVGPTRLPHRIERVAPWFMGGVRAMDWASRVEFPRRIVHQFGRGRCWVLGDAAHQTVPGGAQSMNLGLQEAVQFVDKVRAVLKDGTSPTELREASEKWHASWQRVLGFEPSLVTTPTTPSWVAAHAQQLASCLPASGADFVNLLGQLDLLWTGPGPGP